MSDDLNLLAKGRLNPKVAKLFSTAPAPLAEPESEEVSCLAFGYLRGIAARALTLDFHFKDGNSMAFPYSWLGPVQYDPSAGLVLKFVGDLVYLVKIEGTNLHVSMNGISLTGGLHKHRIAWVREQTAQETRGIADSEITITSVRVSSHRPEESPSENWCVTR